MVNIIREYQFRDFYISTNREILDIHFIHSFLSKESYWAKNIPIEIVEKSIKNSLPFGLYHGNKQIGFARIVTDFAVFATVADVFVIQQYRGLGLSKWLIETFTSFPELQYIRRWTLYTLDAQKLYEKYGFSIIENPEQAMEIHQGNIYDFYTPEFLKEHHLIH